MVHIYEKVCKTDDNQFGIVEISDENPLTKGPCIITILAMPMFLKNINGSLRQVAELVNPDIDFNYDPDRRILGLGFGDYSEQYGRFSKMLPSQEELEEFLIKYFYPLFIENNNKIDVLEAMKRFRNITFLTYCNGAKVFKSIEDRIKEKMKEVGYTDSEIGMVFSQVCLVAISGDVINRKGTSALAISFGDVNDSDYERNEETISSINNLGVGYINYDSSIGFAVANDGEHSFKRHMTGDPVLSSRISAFLNKSIDNALENRNNDVINPITYEKIENAFDVLIDNQGESL